MHTLFFQNIKFYNEDKSFGDIIIDNHVKQFENTSVFM